MSVFSLKVLNTEAELKSFPVNQSIILKSSVLIEDSNIKNNIALIRLQKDVNTFNTSDIYNQNIGYIKENFILVPLNIIIKQVADGYEIVCDPIEPLSPGSRYFLFIDKDLSEEYVEIKKTVSKGPSELILKNYILESLSANTKIKFKVISSPTITATSNIVKLQSSINDQPGQTFLINAKSTNNIFTLNGLTIEVKDTAFALGEEFEVVLQEGKYRLGENLSIIIDTATSTTIKPIDNIAPSHAVTNQDILNYYKSLEDKKSSNTASIDFAKDDWQKSEITIEYLDDNQFLLTLNSLTTDMLDIDKISFKEFPAYNRSDLKMLKLYDKSTSFKMEHEILDDKTIMFTFVEEVI